MKNLFQKYLTVYLAIVLVCVSFIGGLLVGQKTNIFSSPDSFTEQGKLVNAPKTGEKPDYLSQDVDFGLLGDVWQIIRSDYINKDELLDSEMFYGALRGVVASLGDPYSVFFDPKDTEEFAQELEGSFQGIGAEMSIKKDQLVVVSPLPGTPAYNAGLMPGDKVLAIDGQPTALMTLYQAVSLIRGEKGTKVKLLIGRDEWPEPKEIEITRDEVHFDSVSWNFRDDGLVYVKITNFNDDTMRIFNEAVQGILKKNPGGIILDLRGNPGGYLEQAIDVASAWVEDGPVVIEAFDSQKQEYPAKGKALLKDYPTVVLVNGGSASSSEIVAGALQDYKKATLVGQKTFGKGSVQVLKNLSDGSAIKLTIARWLTPSGRNIDQEGIAPDIEVERTREEFDNNKDSQLDKAVEILLNKK